MKTYLINSMCLLYAATLLTACSGQDEPMTSEEQQVPLEINIKGCETRGVITGNTLPDQSSIGIYTVNANDYATHSNVAAICNNNVWELGTTIYLNQDAQKVYAYYPYDKSANIGALTLKTSEQTDCLYGYAVDTDNKLTTVNSANPKANILLKHAMSRLTFVLKKSETNQNDGNVGSLDLSGVYLSATLDIKTGSLKLGDHGDLVTKADIELSTKGQNVDILVLPMSVSTTEVTLLGMYIGNNYYTAQLPSGKWEAGQQYTYTIEVDDSGLKITEATITPWNNNEQSGISVGDDNYVE